ncbi:hypothetical protein C900_00664 [Fulvivirga imtechensis AK7]|uniref:Uncharacterized protein n=1 Tax=Fulvivirga imtechensis AK7 TaxID=1237149 RepID=L8JIY0_9BACT|nr:hypothetical protein C900_00664 [Fulvivirga imtechensis AK7]
MPEIQTNDVQLFAQKIENYKSCFSGADYPGAILFTPPDWGSTLTH